MAKKTTTTSAPAYMPGAERTSYDNTRLSVPCASDRCRGCQERSCSHSCGYPHRASRDRTTRR
ncbi:hypothetical protein [Nonomuraea sp. NPDC050202]|uniref:hypothetical protein n=1 Tax=Nonomuraea sp. NPDC050202 TaxID=3155035 RepID=UPI0033D055FA